MFACSERFDRPFVVEPVREGDIDGIDRGVVNQLWMSGVSKPYLTPEDDNDLGTLI